MRHISLLDRLALIGLIALAAIPFAQIFKLTVGFATFDMSELIELYLVVIFIFIISIRGLILKHTLFVVYVFSVFIIYAWYSLLFLNVSLNLLIEQTRKFLPFFVACIILLSRLYIEIGFLLRILTYSLACSALIAISIHLFFPDYIAYAFSDNEEMQRLVTVEGRMIWGNLSLALFSLAGWILYQNKVFVSLSNCAVIIGSIFCQNRTMLAGLFLFYFLCNCLILKKNKRRLFLYLGLFIVILYFVFTILASRGMLNLLQQRLFLSDNYELELLHSLELGRFPLYIRYLEIFQKTFPFGQGLGVPLSPIDVEVPVFTSDISFISFFIPLGFFGMVMILGYISIIVNYFNFSFYNHPEQQIFGKIFKFLIGTSVLISLNIDLFSRNIFVIYLTVFAVIFYKNVNSIYYRKSENCF